MRVDFKKRTTGSAERWHSLRQHWTQYQRLHITSLVVAIMFGLAIWSLNPNKANIKQDNTAIPNPKSNNHENNWQTFRLTLPKKAKIAQKVPAISNTTAFDNTDWETWTVKSGYNLAIMAQKAGVLPSEIHHLMLANDAVKELAKLYPGDRIRVQQQSGRILALEYDIHDTKRLSVKRTQSEIGGQNPFSAKLVSRPIEIHTTHARGIITDALFTAAKDAGISDRLTMELANIFGWDIDFALDVKSGDQFTLVYEERYRNGEKLLGNRGEGAILAAEFINNGRVLRALRYTLPDGRTDYFAPDGRSLRKAFIRNPIDFTRISSHFNLKRKHPILNKIRAHKGVDYAAKTGTPIRAAGDGKIILRGKKGGYGNTIIIQHGQHYSTLYAHMSKYAKGSELGRRVKQGQTIGYVGQSGLATGPHLHYEFRVNGSHHNPLTVKHPSVDPIPKKYRQQFLADTQKYVSQLDLIGRTYLALALVKKAE